MLHVANNDRKKLTGLIEAAVAEISPKTPGPAISIILLFCVFCLRVFRITVQPQETLMTSLGHDNFVTSAAEYLPEKMSKKKKKEVKVTVT